MQIAKNRLGDNPVAVANPKRTESRALSRTSRGPTSSAGSVSRDDLNINAASKVRSVFSRHQERPATRRATILKLIVTRGARSGDTRDGTRTCCARSRDRGRRCAAGPSRQDLHGVLTPCSPYADVGHATVEVSCRSVRKLAKRRRGIEEQHRTRSDAVGQVRPVELAQKSMRVDSERLPRVLTDRE